MTKKWSPQTTDIFNYLLNLGQKIVTILDILLLKFLLEIVLLIRPQLFDL